MYFFNQPKFEKVQNCFEPFEFGFFSNPVWTAPPSTVPPGPAWRCPTATPSLSLSTSHTSPRLAPVPPISHAYPVARVAHTRHPPLFVWQWRRPRPMVGGHCQPPQATHHCTRPPSPPSPSSTRTRPQGPLSLFLLPAPPSRLQNKTPATARAPFRPVLLSSTPEPPELSAASSSRCSP
jgi:hypothetical protein